MTDTRESTFTSLLAELVDYGMTTLELNSNNVRTALSNVYGNLSGAPEPESQPEPEEMAELKVKFVQTGNMKGPDPSSSFAQVFRSLPSSDEAPPEYEEEEEAFFEDPEEDNDN